MAAFCGFGCARQQLSHGRFLNLATRQGLFSHIANANWEFGIKERHTRPTVPRKPQKSGIGTIIG
jgi:hypothetical protein